MTPLRRAPGTTADVALVEHLAALVRSSSKECTVTGVDVPDPASASVSATDAVDAVLDALDALGLYPDWDARTGGPTPQDAPAGTERHPDATEPATGDDSLARMYAAGQRADDSRPLDKAGVAALIHAAGPIYDDGLAVERIAAEIERLRDRLREALHGWDVNALHAKPRIAEIRREEGLS